MGMVSVANLLISHGVGNLSGWTLREALAVSADGTTIVGEGIDPQGRQQAWRATIPAVPEPTTFAIASVCLLALFLTACRRGQRERRTDVG
jgi:hypothetical protein